MMAVHHRQDGVDPVGWLGARGITGIILFSIILFLYSGCENKLSDIKQLTERKTGVDTARNIDGYRSTEGKLKARLRAPLMLRYSDSIPRIVFPNTLHVDFYDDSLRVESKLDALYAWYIEHQNKVFLRDSVVAINISNGDTLRCSQLWWDQRRERFYTASPARVYRKDMIIFCDSLEAAQTFTNIEFFQVKNSILRVRSSEFPE